MLRGISTLSLTVLNPSYVLTPGGYFHHSCVHRISSPTYFTSESLKPCPFPVLPHHHQQDQAPRPSTNFSHGSAWKAWAQFAPGGSVTSLSSDWIVPGEPGNSAGQTLFFWNGIEPEDTSAGESLECLYSVISFLSLFFLSSFS